MNYRNVKQNPQDLEEMLRLADGGRRVPVILHRGQVSIGWQGRG